MKGIFVTITRADLGQKVYEALSLIFTRSTAPARKTPIAELADNQTRYDAAVVALQELSGYNIGVQPSATSEDSQRRISGLNVLSNDMRQMLTPLMKGADFEIRMPSRPPKMRNSVNYRHYDVLAFVISGNKTMIFAVNDQCQYILSDKMYWVAL